MQHFSDDRKDASMLVATVWLVFYAMAVLRLVIEPAVYPAATALPIDTSEVTAAWK